MRNKVIYNDRFMNNKRIYRIKAIKVFINVGMLKAFFGNSFKIGN
jgi:hypothetical protein